MATTDLKGRVFAHPHEHKRQKFPKSCGRQQTLPVQSASIRNKISTKNIHKVPSSSSCIPPKAGHTCVSLL